MEVLFLGVYKKFFDDSGVEGLKKAITGMYFTEAIQTAVLPYIVYFEISNVPDWTFTEDMENFLIQFSIYSSDSSSVDILSIFEKLKTCYDWKVLTVEGYNFIYLKREFNILTKENDIWKMDVQYRIEVQR